MSRTGPPTAERFYMALRHGGPMGQSLANLVVALLRVVFHAGERLGVHVTPNAFFSPVPDTRLLPDALWTIERALPGVDWREGAQIQLLSESTAHIAEVESLSSERGGPLAYRLENPKFGTVDAHIAYSLVRRHRPRRIVEIGSGWSTLVLMAALDANATQGHPGELVACEPYPDGRLVLAARKDHVRLEPQPLQALPLSVFTDLSADDIVFVDSSHVLKIGSDVHKLVLDVLPRMPVGVLVHFHDIFLPQEYPKDWVLGHHRFYNEQYAVQAFLTFNHAFEILWGGSYMHLRHPDLLEDTIDSYRRDRHHPGSLWIRRHLDR